MFEVNFVEEDLREIIRGLKRKNKKLKKENEELREQLEFYQTQEMLDEEFDEWNREQYGDY